MKRYAIKTVILVLLLWHPWGLLASAGPKAPHRNGEASPTPSPTPAFVVATPTPAPTPLPTPEPIATPTPTPQLGERDRILQQARALIGERETHGSNRSPLIDRMNRLTGVPLGSPYCAAFNAYVYDQAGIDRSRFPLSAWSPAWVAKPTWTRANGGKTPLPADAFGIWFSKLGRVAHTGLVERWESRSAVTVEANTSPSAEFGSASDRDGDGIHRKRRLHSQLHSVRNWLD
jgi:hypothetical protein